MNAAPGQIQRGRRRWGAKLSLMVAAAGIALGGCASIPRDTPSAAEHGSTPAVDCLGAPGPTPSVWLEAGAFGTSADWGRVRRELAKAGRVCAYDRLGLGRSPDRVGPPTPEAIANDLAATLDRLGERRPIILVGHSNGAFYAETFATLFPSRVAGLVYVDGVGTDDLDEPLVADDLRAEETRADLAVMGGRMGLARLVAGSMIDAIGLRGQAARRKWLSLISARHRADARDEVMQIRPGLTRIRALGGAPPRIPVAVIVASQHPRAPLDRAWRRAQAAPALRSCHGWVLDAPGATHVSPLGRDRSYVLAAVRWLRRPGLADEPCAAPVAAP